MKVKEIAVGIGLLLSVSCVCNMKAMDEELKNVEQQDKPKNSIFTCLCGKTVMRETVEKIFKSEIKKGTKRIAEEKELSEESKRISWSEQQEKKKEREKKLEKVEQESLKKVAVESFSSVFLLEKFDCGHIFHKTCIRKYLKEHDVCPTCKKKVSKPKEPEFEEGISNILEKDKLSAEHQELVLKFHLKESCTIQ